MEEYQCSALLNALVPKPMRLNTTYVISKEKIIEIRMDTLSGFLGYGAELQRRRDKFNKWAELNIPDWDGMDVLNIGSLDTVLAKKARAALLVFREEVPYEYPWNQDEEGLCN